MEYRPRYRHQSSPRDLHAFDGHQEWERLLVRCHPAEVASTPSTPPAGHLPASMLLRDSGDVTCASSLISGGISPFRDQRHGGTGTWKRRRPNPASVVIGIVFGLVVSRLLDKVMEDTSLSFPSIKERDIFSWKSASKLPKVGKTPRLWIRTEANEEGIGSALQRIKGGIILAAFFDATFVVGETLSQHGYYHDEVLNPHAFGPDGVDAWQVPSGRVCRISDYLPRYRRDMVIRGACSRLGKGYELGLRVKEQLDERGCTIILEDIVHEVVEDLNACYRNFVRQRIGGIEGRRLDRPSVEGSAVSPDRTALSCGVHIRWGDAEMFEGTMEKPRGSMQLAHINDIISKLRARFVKLDIRVVMENVNATVLGLLDFGDYTVIDSGDSFADLFALADNDVTLLGGSSYSALSHMLAPSKGLSIVEGMDLPNKYLDSTYRAVVLNSGRAVDYVQKIVELFPEVETKPL
ncbi:BZ3500_MvSof-1268-A1-R1_Chr2-2g05023 [Microbotryum saponariae]|uniref:BZ3500_MvSof-1268-A1-R1_Chr2-2g05023 protein n=1 Tax=Microbotryum saponariae TaxID=289078 RepID=A0A2X0N687_9BASI|nr:BZ3500_MvSof-1268-A1-R1_Chr2-2g05023 [Microbotryum saponariae]SDA00726.1 BZ3501_MvSof-1269-A2-R1_Chr2-2g04697 [Microbotryum saponariae]